MIIVGRTLIKLALPSAHSLQGVVGIAGQGPFNVLSPRNLRVHRNVRKAVTILASIYVMQTIVLLKVLVHFLVHDAEHQLLLH